MKALIKIALCFVIAGLLAYIAFLLKAKTFNGFVSDSLLQMLSTIFAINIGILPILFYELNKIESNLRESALFTDIKCEIKQNALTMTTVVLTAIILSVVRGFFEDTGIDYALCAIVLAIVFLAIIMLFDTVSGILALDSTLSQNEGKP